jgi:hypothetical protein
MLRLLRWTQRAPAGQRGHQPPLAARDAEAALAQANDHAARHRQQSAGAVQQQVVERRSGACIGLAQGMIDWMN